MKKEINLEDFNAFINRLAKIELILFSISFILCFFFFSKSFLLSYLIGFIISFLDYYLLFRFSKEVPFRVLSGQYPRSGFLWRFLLISGILLISISLFTRLNFFAIILAVATANLGLFIATIKHGRERGEWKEA